MAGLAVRTELIIQLEKPPSEPPKRHFSLVFLLYLTLSGPDSNNSQRQNAGLQEEGFSAL